MFFIFFEKGFIEIENFEFPQGTDVVLLNKVVTRYFDIFRDRSLQLWAYKVKCKCFAQGNF